MAFSEFERTVNLKSLRWFLDVSRPPEEIRPELDIGYAVIGQTVDVFEIRPDWKDKTTTRHTPVARIKFVRTKAHWILYWMRADLKWHSYKPDDIHCTLLSALKTVNADADGCFFG